MDINMKIVTPEMIADLLARATATPRKRMNLNLHPALSDPTNRFVNAGIAGTYVRPHRHRPHRWEIISVLQGRLDLLLFAAEGEVKARIPLGADGAGLVEIPGGAWHSFVFHAPAAVVLEVKPRPLRTPARQGVAEWAPAEGAGSAISFTAWLETATPGDLWRPMTERTEPTIPPGSRI